MTPGPGLPSDLQLFCITDVGSTTTKARLFFQGTRGWEVAHAEAPTTVERPHEDVTIGVRQAFESLEALTGRSLWDHGRPSIPYLTTSSAGGGLAMVVTGLVTAITSRSAERVALGAGAVVLDVLAMDDGRTPYGKVQALEALRPDMILLAGAFDGDNISGPVFLAEMLTEAALRPKLSSAASLPVIYAGNTQAARFVEETLAGRFAVSVVDNLRPSADRENLGPAHDAIHRVFMDHVMSQAPGYASLLDWVAAPVLPTPSAFGAMLALASRAEKQRILAVDIGGATTDVFTAEHGTVHRTVSANLGMSYSILQVLRRVGVGAICSLLDPPIDPREVIDRIGEKLLHPTRLPQTSADTRVERAVAALAIREAVRDHLRVLRGVSLDRGGEELQIRSIFGGKVEQSGGADKGKGDPGPLPARKPESLRGYDQVIGSGGILSHAEPGVAARILLDGLEPESKTELAIDRGFVIPHLGVLGSVQPELALTLFRRLAVESLGSTKECRGRWTGRAGSIGAGESQEADASAGSAGGDSADVQPPHPQRIRLRRELIIPGHVSVGMGQSVSSETVIARCTRLFPRPFFLKPAGALDCKQEEVASYLLKRQGDVLQVGTLLAQRKVNRVTTKEFHSSVAGTIERILPDGTIVVREQPEMAQEVWTVDLARDLDIQPKRLAPHIRCHVGQEVEKGQWLAADTGAGIPRFSPCPGRGRIEEIDLATGRVRIHPLLEELQVKAWLPGTVIEVTSRGAVIEGNGIELAGAWGLGREASGTLALASRSSDIRASIIAHDGSVTRALLEGWAEQGVAGVIAAGAPLADLQEWAPPFPLVLMEGFGARRFGPVTRELLSAHVGGWALLDGTTEIRVGVRRPRVILVGEVAIR